MSVKFTTAVTASLATAVAFAVTVPAAAAQAGPRTTPQTTVTAKATTAMTTTTALNALATTAPLTATDTKILGLVDAHMAILKRDAPIGAPPGVWNTTVTCWRCDAAPGLALAAAAALTNDPARRASAEAVLDHHLAAHRHANGSFGTTTTTGSSDIETMFFANILGMSAVLLKPTMDPARHARWSAAVAGAADFLIANRNLAWYTNGNIVLGNTLTMALAARLTGNVKYTTAYETAFTFAVSPPQARWPGYGFFYTTKGTRADGVDGKGYFTEEGVGGKGFDPEYTQVQLDFLAGLYLINGDPRAKMYLNLLTNQLDPRVHKVSFILDTSGGTRFPQLGRIFPYDTPSMSVLGNVGGRADIAAYLPAQWNLISKGWISTQAGRARSAFGWGTAVMLMSQPGNTRLR